ncbi:protein LSM12 homolog A [Ciona intestinalis]
MQITSMAAIAPSNDYFYPGSIVKCTTCHGEVIQGEVITFDHDSKILLLKQPSSCGKSDLNNVSMLNLDLVKSVTLIKECDAPLPSLTPLSSSKLYQRFNEEVELKTMLAKARDSGVSTEGINLYLCLKKLLPCTLKEQSILVMDEVLVHPPYLTTDCVAKDAKIPNSQCLEHVRDLVGRFHKGDKSKLQQGNS